MAVLKIFWRLRSAARYFIEVLIGGPDAGESQELDGTKSSSDIEAAHRLLFLWFQPPGCRVLHRCLRTV